MLPLKNLPEFQPMELKYEPGKDIYSMSSPTFGLSFYGCWDNFTRMTAVFVNSLMPCVGFSRIMFWSYVTIVSTVSYILLKKQIPIPIFMNNYWIP